MADGAAPGVLTPARPQLAAALACVFPTEAPETIARWLGTIGVRFRFEPAESLPGDVTDPAEAWEALATRGVIPDAWVGDARRAFACVCERGWLYDTASGNRIGRPCEVCNFLAPLPHPPTVAACVALAADVPGVLAAEALARECVARLAAFGAPQPQAIVWRVAPMPEFRCGGPGDDPHWFDPLTAALIATFSSGGIPGLADRADKQFIRWQLLNAHEWAAAAANDRRVPEIPGDPWHNAPWPRELIGRRFADLPDPFAPLVELWATGYALDAITDDDALVLVCPSLGADGTVAP